MKLVYLNSRDNHLQSLEIAYSYDHIYEERRTDEVFTLR